METRTIAFVTDKRFVRRAREQRTVDAMMAMYCAHHHAPRTGLCVECAELSEYARRRLERCVFGDAKPTCANCVVHCYTPAMREKMRVMMRWAGPRMLLKHPVLALHHMLDGRRPAPLLPEKRA